MQCIHSLGSNKWFVIFPEELTLKVAALKYSPTQRVLNLSASMK